ncbi:low molecular weight protein-tyrosine-phosphatase [Pasteurella sp. PK-2025]|uniref:low molecular weight protein-tyrosine-phosphatase n=1 Tax=Pasteurella sp. PK-2025 TaxID=3413133 RepID=UPI003C78701C
MFEKILVVCMGNICRSPVGEALLKQIFPEKTIESAGIISERSRLVGKPVDEMMQKTAQNHQLDLSAHRARQLTEPLCHQADLILVMEKKHFGLVHQIAPTSLGKIMLFGHWLPVQQEIPDPFQKSQVIFEQVYEMLVHAAKQWEPKLIGY